MDDIESFCLVGLGISAVGLLEMERGNHPWRSPGPIITSRTAKPSTVCANAYQKYIASAKEARILNAQRQLWAWIRSLDPTLRLTTHEACENVNSIAPGFPGSAP
jgi:hypothetical protein